MAGFVEDMLIQFLASRALRAGAYNNNNNNNKNAYHHGRVRIPHSAVPLLAPSRKQRSLVVIALKIFMVLGRNLGILCV